MTRAPARGFTLLEVMVALAILGVGIVTIMQLFSGSLQVQDRAARQMRAVLYAREAMDRLLFDAGPDDPFWKICGREDRLAGGLVRKIECHEGDCDGDAAQDRDKDHDKDTESDYTLWCLRVNVTWQDGRGDKTFSLTSMRIAEPKDAL